MQPESADCPGIDFSATLPADQRRAVEALFFFNPRQAASLPGIRATVQETGIPELVEQEGRIRIETPGGTTQCLFACDRARTPPKLVGVVLYGRPAADCLRISHIAVDPGYTAANSADGTGLGLVLIERVRTIARSIKGVTRIQLPYTHDGFLPV